MVEYTHCESSAMYNGIGRLTYNVINNIIIVQYTSVIFNVGDIEPQWLEREDQWLCHVVQ